MYIDFDRKNMRFMLNTDNTAYIFEIVGGKFPVHRYYGKKIDRPEFMRQSTIPFHRISSVRTLIFQWRMSLWNFRFSGAEISGVPP